MRDFAVSALEILGLKFWALLREMSSFRIHGGRMHSDFPAIRLQGQLLRMYPMHPKPRELQNQASSVEKVRMQIIITFLQLHDISRHSLYERRCIPKSKRPPTTLTHCPKMKAKPSKSSPDGARATHPRPQEMQQPSAASGSTSLS